MGQYRVPASYFETTEANMNLKSNQNRGDICIVGTAVPYKIFQWDGGSWKEMMFNNGLTVYHITKWFTPTGTVSTNSTTVTSVGTQFTSSMVGAKITINNEERLITAYTSTTQVTVNYPYSQNLNLVAAGSWGVYSKAIEVKNDGSMVYYIPSGIISFQHKNDGVVYINALVSSNNKYNFQGPTGDILLSSDQMTKYSSTVLASGTKDVGFKRNADGVLEINDGNTAGVYRDLNLRNLTHTGTITNASDERLKDNIRPITDGLEKVLKLAECSKHFEFKDQSLYAKGQRTGFIAQLLRQNGFEGHVSERLPLNETEGLLFGWEYGDEQYEELNVETGEAEVKTRRIVTKVGDMILQVENNFAPYAYAAIKELYEENVLLKDRLKVIEEKLGIQ